MTLRHPKDKHSMLRLKGTSAGHQGGESGEKISGVAGCELVVNNFLNHRHFKAHRLHTCRVYAQPFI